MALQAQDYRCASVGLSFDTGLLGDLGYRQDQPLRISAHLSLDRPGWKSDGLVERDEVRTSSSLHGWQVLVPAPDEQGRDIRINRRAGEAAQALLSVLIDEGRHVFPVLIADAAANQGQCLYRFFFERNIYSIPPISSFRCFFDPFSQRYGGSADFDSVNRVWTQAPPAGSNPAFESGILALEKTIIAIAGLGRPLPSIG